MCIECHIELFRGITHGAASSSGPVITDACFCTDIASPAKGLVATHDDVNIATSHLNHITPRGGGDDFYSVDIFRVHRPESLLDGLVAHLSDTPIEHKTGWTLAENHGSTSRHTHHRHAVEQFLSIEPTCKLVVADDIQQTVCLTADNGHPSTDRDTTQVVVFHLHADGADITDSHHPLDGLISYATDSHPCLLCPAGYHKVASLIAHATTYVCGIGRWKEGDVSVGNGLAVWTYESPYQFRAVFLHTLHEYLMVFGRYTDGVETTYIAHCIRQGAPSPNRLGDSEILQFVIDKRDAVVL